MKTSLQTPGKPKLEKVGECLYRYSSNGVYYALVKDRGKQKKCSLNTTDKALAKRKLADFKRNLGKVDSSAGRVTLRECCTRYLETVQNQKARTKRRKEDIVRRLLADLPNGPDCLISKIRKSDLQSWLAGYEFGAASQNLYVHCIRSIFTLAVDDKLIHESPAADIKALKRGKPIRRTPTFKDFLAIIADVRAQVHNADSDDSADFLELLGLAGLGQAEASALRWGDVDWERGEITTFRHKTSKGFVIPIYPQLRPLLERLRGDRDPATDDPVLRIKDAKKALAGACRRLNLPAYSQRALRRMFITRALEKGIDVKVIAQWQGHTDGGKLILDTYSHVSPQHVKRMAQLMTE